MEIIYFTLLLMILLCYIYPQYLKILIEEILFKLLVFVLTITLEIIIIISTVVINLFLTQSHCKVEKIITLNYSILIGIMMVLIYWPLLKLHRHFQAQKLILLLKSNKSKSPILQNMKLIMLKYGTSKMPLNLTSYIETQQLELFNGTEPQILTLGNNGLNQFLEISLIGLLDIMEHK